MQGMISDYDDITLDEAYVEALSSCAFATDDFYTIVKISTIMDSMYRKHQNQTFADAYLSVISRYVKTARHIGDIASIQVTALALMKNFPGIEALFCNLIMNVETIRMAPDISVVHTSFHNLDTLFEIISTDVPGSCDMAAQYILGCSYATEITGIDWMKNLNKAYDKAKQYESLNNPDFFKLAYDTYVQTKRHEALDILKESYYESIFHSILRDPLLIRGTVSYLSLSPYLMPFIWDCPERVYHYTDLYALKSIIENNKFWATNHRFLNDTEEKKYIKTVLEELKTKNVACDLYKVFDNVSAFIDGTQSTCEYEVSHEEQVRYASDAYIISFSLNKDSLTLWSEYAKKSGINIGIDCQKLRKDVMYDQTGIYEDVFGGRVIYIDQADEDDANLKKIKNLISEIIMDCEIYGISTEVRDAMLEAHLIYLSNFLKDSSMQAEEEYRLVYFSKDDKQEIKIRVREELLIPYIEYQEEICSAITSITVAPANKNYLTLEGMQYLLQKHGIKSYIAEENQTEPIQDKVRISQSQITLRY